MIGQFKVDNWFNGLERLSTHILFSYVNEIMQAGLKLQIIKHNVVYILNPLYFFISLF